MITEMIRTNVSPPMNGDSVGTIIQFYMGSEESHIRSLEAGHPVHEDYEYINISFAGDHTKIIDRKVTPEDKMRFDKQYGAWKANAKEAMIGTPLQELPFLTAAAIADLNYHKVHNVETLADLPDSAVQNIGMGAQGWKNKAKEFLTVTKVGSDKKKLVAENLTLKTDIEALKKQVADLASLIEKPQKNRAA